MRRIIRRKKSGYALGFTLFFIGSIALSAVLWKAWSNVSTSDDMFSDLGAYLWADHFESGLGVRLKLMHLTMLGAATLALGIFVLVFSRQVFSVYSGENVLLQCSFCKNRWKANRGKGLAECPHCHQFAEQRVVKNGK
jgi:hypothetical protein